MLLIERIPEAASFATSQSGEDPTRTPRTIRAT